jgi:hypothetical protein
MAQECTQAFRSDRSLPDVLMSIPVRPELHLGIIEMEALQAFDTNGPVDRGQQLIGTRGCGERHSGRPEVLCVQTDPEPFVTPGSIDYVTQLIERAADRVPRSRCVFEQDGAGPGHGHHGIQSLN